MSKYVIMETVDGMSNPVAIRDTKGQAQARCEELANMRSQKADGRVERFDGGAIFQVFSASYTAIEITDADSVL